MTKQINVTVPDFVHDFLTAESSDEDRKLGAHTSRVLRLYVEGKATPTHPQGVSDSTS